MSTFTLSRPMHRPAAGRVDAVPAQRPTSAPWLVMLADWAERQPRHRRLGGWTLLARAAR